MNIIDPMDATLEKAYRKRHLTAALKWIKRRWLCFRGNHLDTGVIRDGAYYWYCRGCGKEL